MRIRPLLIHIALIPLLLMGACKDTPVHQAAKALLETEEALKAFEKTVIAANADKLISDADTTAIMERTLQINASGKRAGTMLRLMDSMKITDPTSIINVLDQVSLDLAALASSLRIPDEKLRKSIAAAIQLAQASLNTAKVILAATVPKVTATSTGFDGLQLYAVTGFVCESPAGMDMPGLVCDQHSPWKRIDVLANTTTQVKDDGKPDSRHLLAGVTP